MLSIAIHHNIWLTRDQRYAIHEGTEIVVVGVSIPVWVHDNRVTSEPAKEVFCKYYLKNPKQELEIQIMKDGYVINIPNNEGSVPNLSDEEWRYLNFNFPQKLEACYDKCQRSVTSKNLLDIKDGGSKYLSFREHNKIKSNDELINFIHFVNISDMDELNKSIV